MSKQKLEKPLETRKMILTNFYEDYLKLDNLLSLQNPKTWATDKPIHEEMLFVIVHQTSELWFKQILQELDSLIDLFEENKEDDLHLIKIVNRLTVIAGIYKLLVEELMILATMPHQSFAQFRSFLSAGSGIQSKQFQLIEKKLGFCHNHTSQDNLSGEHQESKNLLVAINHWLKSDQFLSSKSQLINEADKNDAVNHFKKNHQPGKLTLGTVLSLLTIYNDCQQPEFKLRYQIMQSLQEVEKWRRLWLKRHITLAQKYIGKQVGTGGTQGVKYLEKRLERCSVLSDFTLT